MDRVGADFRQKDCEIRESFLEDNQLIHKPFRYTPFRFSVTDIRNRDLIVGIEEFMVLKVR